MLPFQNRHNQAEFRRKTISVVADTETIPKRREARDPNQAP
ncbi:hypothetical protein AALP_AA2G245900 [Arabis alpina]|uniref:Uncharacterized protein n=1 Tax=Arabis alpina TaxID=50452 RepID=A0A087HJR1_ARAAL|nr:hypothetical protein AALP_AA2G245900 [Arabis alpina]